MKLDLSDLSGWSDRDVVDALEEVEGGLGKKPLWWVETLGKAFRESGRLSPKQRATLENILREWNEDQ